MNATNSTHSADVVVETAADEKPHEHKHLTRADLFEKPGTIVEMSDRKYLVGPRGNFVRVKDKK